MVDPTEGLFAVPDLFGGTVPVCWSYGMGVESTCGVVRTLLQPQFRPAELLEDLPNLIVLIAQTGDEWTRPTTWSPPTSCHCCDRLRFAWSKSPARAPRPRTALSYCRTPGNRCSCTPTRRSTASTR